MILRLFIMGICMNFKSQFLWYRSVVFAPIDEPNSQEFMSVVIDKYFSCDDKLI